MAFSDVKIHYYQSMFRIRGRRFLVYFAVILIACISSFACTAQVANSKIQDQIQEHFLAAQQAQQQGLLDKAAQEYQTVLHLQPGLPEAYVNLGLVYYAQAKFDESARALTAAAKIRPGMHGLSLWLGIDDVKLSRPMQAIPLLREAIRQNPNEKLAQSWLGTALWDAGQTNAALLQLRNAAALFPDDPDFLFACGEAYGKAANQETEQLLDESTGTALSDLIYGTHYAEERDWIKAEGHLRRAIERDPHSMDARLELAKVFIQQANLPAAQELLARTPETTPQSAALLALTGEVSLLMQHQAKGLMQIESALEINSNEALDTLGLPPQNAILKEQVETAIAPLSRETAQKLDMNAASSSAGKTSRAALLALAGDEDAALQAYKQIETARASASLTSNLFGQAITAMDQHDFQGAEQLTLRWLAVHPNDHAARYTLILARRNISMENVVRLVALAPDSYHLHQLLGQLYASREEDDKALTEYLAVAAVRPDLPGIHFWLGHLYWKHGDADHAIAELTRELQLSPGYPEAEAELGTVLVAEERAAEAIPHLQSAIHSKHDLWPAYGQLGRAYAFEKDYARAEEVLRAGLAHDQDASTHYQLAMVLRAEGKTAQAAQVFAQVRAIKTEAMAATANDDAAAQSTPRGETRQ